MAATRLAVVLDGLVAHLTAMLPELNVIDGQPIDFDDEDLLIVGWSPNEAAIEVVQEREDLRRRRGERYSVMNIVSAIDGSTDPEAVRAVRGRAVNHYVRVGWALEQDRTLGGLVLSAELGTDYALDPQQSTSGAAATIQFPIVLRVHAP